MARRAPILFSLAASMAMGSAVDGTSASGELTGSRDSTLGGVTVAGAVDPAFDVSWVITLNAGVYDYTYTVTGPAGSGLGVSHLALGISSSCPADVNCLTDA